MPTRPIQLLLALLPGFLAPLPASAQAQRGEPPQWYDVEIVVFEQAGGTMVAPPARVNEPDTSDAVSLDELSESGEPGAAPSPAMPTLPPLGPQQPSFQLLPVEDQTFGSLLEKLNESARYRVIVHDAWRQRAPEFGESEPVRIQGGPVLGSRPPRQGGTGPNGASSLVSVAANPEGSSGEPISQLDGIAAISRGRYLHLRLNLVYRERAETGLLGRSGADFAAPGLVTYRLSERRQVAPGQLQYFDHERFGAIAVVRPWQPPEERDASPGDGGAPRQVGTTD